MQTLVLWLLALYGFTMAWIQLKRLVHRPKLKKSKVHCYIYVEQSQGQIEWVLRSLNQISKLEGREISFFIIDNGSNDDTLKIVQRFVRQYDYNIVMLPAVPDEETPNCFRIVIDLREGEHSCVLRATSSQMSK